MPDVITQYDLRVHAAYLLFTEWEIFIDEYASGFDHGYHKYLSLGVEINPYNLEVTIYTLDYSDKEITLTPENFLKVSGVYTKGKDDSLNIVVCF